MQLILFQHIFKTFVIPERYQSLAGHAWRAGLRLNHRRLVVWNLIVVDPSNTILLKETFPVDAARCL